MRIAVLANLKVNAPPRGTSNDAWDDLDSPDTVEALVAALERAGHQAAFFEASLAPPHNLIERLRGYDPDICFNIAEGHRGDGREAQIPAVLEMLNIPYTGSQVLTLALALDKPMTKRLLWYHDLPTPEFQVFERADDPIDGDLLTKDGELRYPLFVKPSREGTSIGVTSDSIVYTVDALRQQVAAQLTRYHQPILVEHFIEGRELMVGLVGNLGPTASRRLNERTRHTDIPDGLTFFPVLEVATDADIYTGEKGVYTNRMKTVLADDYRYDCPALLDEALENELKQLTAAVFRVTGCKDVARVDFRLDAANDNKPYILEVNPLPGLNPSISDLCLQAQAMGWTHDELVNVILNEAMYRYGMIQFGGHRRRNIRV